MIQYPDTSFLCALYRKQSNTSEALVFRTAMSEPLFASTLLEFEFLQSLRLQVWLHALDKSKGFSQVEADRIVIAWETALAEEEIQIVSCDQDAVLQVAKVLSKQHTAVGGHRSLDILHVATAVYLQASQFLTFDTRQKMLARACGLQTPL